MGSSISVILKKKSRTISFDKKVSYLKHTPFFQYLTAEAVEEFAQCFPTTITSLPGMNVALDSKRIYVVAEGEVDLSTSFPAEGSKVEAKGYLCRKRQGDIVNVFQTKKDVERRMTVNKKLKELAEEIITVGCGDKELVLLCGDMDALDKFNKAHPELSKPIEAIYNNTIEDRLQNIPFLKEVSKSKLGVLAAMCRYEAFESNQIIFEEDSEADKLFLVLSGVAQVVAKNFPPSVSGAPSTSPSSSNAARITEQRLTLQRSLECSGDRKSALVGTDEVIIAELKSGEYFGETALVFNIDRTCCVRTGEKSLFLTVHRTDFENFLKICPIEESLTAVIKRRMVSKLSTLGIPFLAGIPEEMISSLTNSVAIEEVAKDAIIFQQGDLGDKFYIVVHGAVKVDAVSADNEPAKDEQIIESVSSHGDSEGNDQATKEIGTLGPGQYFGEMALVAGHGLRSATVTSIHKSIMLSVDKNSFKRIFGSNSQVLAEFELRVLKSSAKLKHILAHSLGVASFRNFIEKEHAGENIDFWIAVQDFIEAMTGKNNPPLSNAECLVKAKQIFIKFCADYADRQVNLPHNMLLEIDAKINGKDNITSDLFDASRDEIYRLMEKDKFGRYKNSEDFKDFFVRLGIL